jgi:hypothetical protein
LDIASGEIHFYSNYETKGGKMTRTHRIHTANIAYVEEWNKSKSEWVKST